MSKAKKESKEENKVLASVFYTDGGKRPIGTGWGLHGYSYSIDGKVLKSKNADQPTDLGYLNKMQKITKFNKDGEEVTLQQFDVMDDKPVDEKINTTLRKKPIKKQPLAFKETGLKAKPVKQEDVYDAWGAMSEEDSNNTAELFAVKYALQVANDFNHIKTKIISDSQYAILGASNIDASASGGWLNSKGQTMSNLHIWKDIKKEIERAVESNREIQFVWVKGHSGEKGNDLADTNATKGLILSYKTDSIETILKIESAKTYEKTEYDYSRLLCYSHWYYKTHTCSFKQENEDLYSYVIGSHNSKVEMLGKRAIDHCYGLVKLKEPLELLHKTHDAQTKFIGETARDICIANISTLFNKRVAKEVELNDYDYLYPSDGPNKDLILFDKVENGGVIVSEVLRPQKLANRTFDYADLLNYVVTSFLENDTSIVATDITSLIQTTETTPKGKITYKLSEEIKDPIGRMEVEVKYKLVKEGTKKFKLAVGFELPSKNCFNRLIGPEFKAHVLTWKECDIALRYAVVVQSEEGYGIYATHSNCISVLE